MSPQAEPISTMESHRGLNVAHSGYFMVIFPGTLRILGMSWGVKTTCFKAPGGSLGGSGVSIGGVRILRVVK